MDNRILLKLSGEAMAGDQGQGINDSIMMALAAQIKTLHEEGLEIAIVIGGGNFWRGRSSQHMDRVKADYIGMLATTMNALAFSDALHRNGIKSTVLHSLDMPKVSPLFTKDLALKCWEEKHVIVLAGGTGNPFFSTDSTAALRGAELEVDIVLKATLVDGVYDKDPHKYPDAIMYDELSHTELLEKGLAVIDATAAALLRDNNIPLRVFNMQKEGNILAAGRGEDIGTLVR